MYIMRKYNLKILSSIFILSFLISNCAIAKENSVININTPLHVKSQAIKANPDFFVDTRIEKELKTSIQNVYGQDRVEEVYNRVM